MSHKPREEESALSTEEMRQIEELKKQITDLPKDNPKACEGLIRELFKKISEIRKETEKERLHSELKTVSCCGLNGDLKKLVEENGLSMEALKLVLRYLTTVQELAQYFFDHPKGVVFHLYI